MNGYRIHGEEQVAGAQLIGLLRRLQMPLTTIAEVVSAEPAAAVSIVSAYWSHETAEMAKRQQLVAYLRARLQGVAQTVYEIATRSIPSGDVLSVSRHLHHDEIDQFLARAFARVRAGGAGLAGIAGAPYLARGVGRGARARRGRTAAPGPHRRPTDGLAGDAGLRPDHPVATATADRGRTCGVMFRMRRPGPADLALPT